MQGVPEADQLANLRDVGGLPTADGRTTRTGVLLRSDAPMDGDAAPAGVAWPPRLVVDLRSPTEHGGAHPLRAAGIEVISCPVAEDANVERIAEAHADLDALYANLLDRRGDALAEAVRAIARAGGPVLVHCAVGKDRTGVVVALVLSALGVPDDVVVADYHATEANMPAVMRRHARDPSVEDALAELIERRPDLATAPEASMRRVLALLAQRGGARAFLLARGLDQADLDALERTLLG